MQWANLIVAGAPKCGCTTLLKLLDAHPSIYFHPQKDIPVFTKEENLEDFEAYSSQFASLAEEHPEADYIGDFNPSYFFNGSVPKRLHDYLEEPRLLLLLRDPARRTISHYWHKHKKFEDKRPIEQVFDFESRNLPDVIQEEKQAVIEAIKIGSIDPSSATARYDAPEAPFRYLHVSHYLPHLKNFFRHLDRRKMLIVGTGVLASTPKKAMNEIYDFLGVKTVYPDDLGQYFNKTRVPRSDFLSEFLHHGVKPLLPTWIKNFNALQSLYNTIAFQEKPKTPKRIRNYLDDLFMSATNELTEIVGDEVVETWHSA